MATKEEALAALREVRGVLAHKDEDLDFPELLDRAIAYLETAEALDGFLADLKKTGLPWTLGTCAGGFCAMVGFCGSGTVPWATPLEALRAAWHVASAAPGASAEAGEPGGRP